MSGAKMILNARYFHIAKPGESLNKFSFSSESAAALVNYIATRETVVFNFTPEYASVPATDNQRAAIQKFLEASPDIKKAREWTAYEADKSAANATALITRATDYVFGIHRNGEIAADSLPATHAQRGRINDFVQRVPELKNTPEYIDYRMSPTRENASEVLSHSLEVAMESAASPETIQIMLNYIAERPGVEKNGNAHGLFSAAETTDLNEMKEKISNHTGNIYSFVFSLRRPDADRLGFNQQAAWRDIVLRKQDEIATQTNIPLQDLRWVAAVHNTKHHPHMHFIFYSAHPSSQNFVTTKSIEKIKQTFATDIFQNDLQNIYEPKTALEQKIKEEIETLATSIQQNTPQIISSSSTLQQQLLTLRAAIDSLPGGRKVYKYMPPEIKGLVDSVLKDIEQLPQINALLQQYADLQTEIAGLYKNDTKQKNDLLSSATAKSSLYFAKNAVIRAALQIDSPTIEIDFTEAAPLPTRNDPPPDLTPEAPARDHSPPDLTHEAPTRDPDISFPSVKASGGTHNQSDPTQMGKNYQDACSGNTQAQFKYARYCQYDLADLAQAAMWYGIAANQGHHIEAAYSLAQIYLKDNVEFRDENLGNQYLLQAKLGIDSFLLESNNRYLIEEIQAGQSFEHARDKWDFTDEEKFTNEEKQHTRKLARYEYLLGRIYLAGVEIENMDGIEPADIPCLQLPTDPHKALAYLKLAYETGEHTMAPFYIGKIYYRGDVTDEPDYTQASEWYQKGEKNALCRYALARMYEQGLGVDRSFEQAETLYRSCLADERCGADAAYSIAEMIHSGKVHGTPDRMHALYHQAATAWLQDETRSTFVNMRLARMYEQGLGVQRNYNIAAAYYCTAANDGNAYSAYKAATCFTKLSDNTRSVMYFKQALKGFLELESQSPDAQRELLIGSMYQYGKGCTRNYTLAAEWYTTAAKHGAEEEARERLESLHNGEKARQLSAANIVISLLNTIAASVNINAQAQQQNPQSAGLSQRQQRRMRRALGQKHDYEQTWR